MMSLPSSLLAFALFKTLQHSYSAASNQNRHRFLSFLDEPFTDVENVFVQSLAVAVGTGPLAFGFVGVIPAIEKFLTPEEAGLPSNSTLLSTRETSHHVESPIAFSLLQLVVWSSALSLFGVFFGVLLRKQIIVRERLRFPSGSATATMIAVLHQNEISDIHSDDAPTEPEYEYDSVSNSDSEEEPSMTPADTSRLEHLSQKTYSENIRILLISFSVSAAYSLISYFFPILKNLPLFGGTLAKNYLWTFQPSPAYFGQGIIMGLPTVSAMLFGAILGWAVLGPLSQRQGWATGPVDDWKTGAQGWILWVSLAIMVADTVISFLTITTISVHRMASQGGSSRLWSLYNRFKTSFNSDGQAYTTLNSTETDEHEESPESDPDAVPKHTVSIPLAILGLVLSCIYCVVALKLTFLLPTRETLPSFHFQMPVLPIVAAVLLALLLAVLGVRALGETDLNPVSGIGKISQLVFALLLPPASHPAAVLINLVAGGVTEAGAQQAGDLMQDLKTGHLVGASPRAQFVAQVIGSIWSVVLSAAVYRLYDTVYELPGQVFRIPTAVVWIDCARLVTGKGLPPHAGAFAWAFGVVFGLLAMIKTLAPKLALKAQSTGSETTRLGSPEAQPGASPRQTSLTHWASPAGAFLRRVLGQAAAHARYIPSGVAVGIGIYNTPSFTLARFCGGLFAAFWVRRHAAGDGAAGHGATLKLVVLSSGLVLGEGVFSIVSLVMTGLGVPHF